MRNLMGNSPEILDYASPKIAQGDKPLPRLELGVLAVLAVLANLAFFGLFAQEMHRDSWVYHDLMQDPRSYGREIDPVTILSLRDRYSFWAAVMSFETALAFGILLAVHLLVTVVMIERKSITAARRLLQYRRWKPVGLALTLVTLTWFGHEQSNFWIDATRHIPQGSGNYIEDIVIDGVIIAFGMLPWKLIGKRTADPAMVEQVS